MYKIERVDINEFWHRFDVSCEFNEDVNIIIGRNGTGKTTFMNILHAILTVDPIGLVENDFEIARILLKNDNKQVKTIVVKKLKMNILIFRLLNIKFQIKNTDLD